MEYVIIGDGDIYSVSDRFVQCIQASYDLAEAIDGDMSEIIDKIKEHGTFIGTVSMVIRD